LISSSSPAIRCTNFWFMGADYSIMGTKIGGKLTLVSKTTKKIISPAFFGVLSLV